MGFWSSLFGRRAKSLPIKRVAAPPSQAELLPIDRPDDVFASFHREIDRVFGALATGLNEISPQIKVDEGERVIEITAEMPGVAEKDVEVSLADDVLTIRGRKGTDKSSKGKRGTIRQQSFAAFQRSLRLPPGTDAAKVRASFEKGVLRVSVPKGKAEPVRKIAVKAR